MNAINWMISKAQYEVLEDGTVSFFFSGTLPYRMVQEIKAVATAERGTNNQSSYSHNDELTGWSMVIGARKSTETSVKFSFNDYSIPASKAE